MRACCFCIIAAMAPVCAVASQQVRRDLPHFEKNTGQADASVRYLSRGQYHSVLLKQDRATILLSSSAKRAAVDMVFAGANSAPQLTASGLLPAKTNHFLGSDRSKWLRNIPNYSTVRYSNLYRGIDLVYYGNASKLEYDFVVAPGADPSNIALRFSGERATRVTADGSLVISTDAGDIRQDPPVVYQDGRAGRTIIAGNYVVRGNGSVGFRVGKYDRTAPLIIDPVLTFATYLGGSGNEASSAIAADAAGNIYVTGSTTSANFPTLGGRQAAYAGSRDAFVAKYTAAGTLVYATFVGGGDLDAPESMVVDAAGNVAVFGLTASTNFPLVDAIQGQNRGGYFGFDTFLFRLNPSGSELLASTYIGGNEDELAGGIAIDREGALYLTGTTGSTNFPITPNVYQATLRGNEFNAFVMKCAATGKNITWSTYIGGSGSDFPHGIAVDGQLNSYISGVTTSRDFPGAATGIQTSNRGGLRDAFAFKMNPSGQAVLYSTYLGGSGTESNWDIAVDNEGNAYLTGGTESTDFPVTSGAFQTTLSGPSDAYVVKINAAGTAFVYSTLFGGNRIDRAEEIVVGPNGTVWFAGDSSSSNVVMQNALQPSLRGGADAFVAQLNAAGTAVLNSTYFGGDGIDIVGGMIVDAQQNITLLGDSDSSNLTTNAPASHQRIFGGGQQDSFVARLNFAESPAQLTISPARLDFTGSAGASMGSQTIGIVAPQGSNINWIAEASTTTGGSWLTVNPSRGTGTGSISVFVQPGNLQAGTYNGTVTITNQASNTRTQIPIALALTASTGAQVPANGVVNAASFQGGAVAAGEITTIYGTRMGPASITNATLGADGRFPTTLAGVRVLFDNTPAPLIYVSETQLAAIVPYSVAGKTTTQLQVEVQGNRSNGVTLQVSPAAPAIFTANSSGRGQGAILNQDNSFNSAANPAEKGSIIVLFTTGEGQTTPAGVDGQVAASSFPKPVLPVSVRIGGVDAEVLYAGAAPGLVAGVMQVNVRVPAGAPSGDVPVTLLVGTNESPAGVTVAVQ